MSAGKFLPRANKKYQQSLTLPQLAGDMTITVSVPPTNYPTNITINYGGSTEEEVLVNGISGNTLSLSSGLLYPHSQNETVEDLNDPEDVNNIANAYEQDHSSDGSHIISHFGLPDFVVSGLTIPTSSNLTASSTSGVAFITGIKTNVPSDYGYTYQASMDTYVDVDNTGVYHRTPVALASAAPAIYANSIRIAKVTTSGTAITSVTDLRALKPTQNVTVLPGTGITISQDPSTGAYTITNSGQPASGVLLQGSTPGTPQTGHINVSGTIIAGSFSGDGSALTGIPTTAQVNAKEPSLGNPSTNGYVLSSTTSGTRSWIAALLNPMTTLGDIVTGGASGIAQRLGIGTAGQFLKVVSGVPAWTSLASSDITTALGYTAQSQIAAVGVLKGSGSGSISVAGASDIESALGFTPVNKAGDTLTGLLTLVAGTTTITPLKFVVGTLNTTPVTGGIEFDGTLLYYSDNQSTPVRHQFVSNDATQTLSNKTLLSTASNIIDATKLQTIPVSTTAPTNGQVLQYNSTLNVWQPSSQTALTNPMTTAQDMIVGGAAGAPQRLAVGTSNQFLRVVSGTITWVTLASSDITTALGFTPYDSANPSNYIALTALSGTSPITYNNTTGAIGINQATTSTDGYLSHTDWNTFNGKQASLGYTPLNKAGDTMTGLLTLFTSTSSVGALNIPAGTLLTTPVNGTIENNGTHLYVTLGGTRYQLDQQSAGGGSTTLAGDTDVSISSPSNGQLLQYNSSSSKWQNWTPNYLTGITSGQVTTALGFTPLNKAGDTLTGNLKFNAGTTSVAPATFQSGSLLATPVAFSLENDANYLYYTDNAGTPVRHTLVSLDQTQTLTNKTLTSPVISTIVNTGTLTLPTSTDTLVGRATTDTLTNKRITQRVASTTSSATVTTNSDSYDMQVVSAQAAGLTIANPTGTPTEGQLLMYRIKDNGTSQTISYGTNFRASTSQALPTATTVSKWMYLGFSWNNTDSKWDFIAYINGF